MFVGAYILRNKYAHKHQSDTPRDILIRFVESLRQFTDGQGDREEIERIPSPAKKGHQEEHPLLEIEQSQKLERIFERIHGRLESRNARGEVSSYGHLLTRRLASGRLTTIVPLIMDRCILFIVLRHLVYTIISCRDSQSLASLLDIWRILERMPTVQASAQDA